MASQATTQRSESVFNPPSSPVSYLAILAALVTGVIHLLLGPNVMDFSQLMGVLFILNGLGFLGGIALYVTSYWRRELYLVATGYALVTVIALFVFQGFSLDAFYMGESINPMAVGAKVAELVVAMSTGYLYTQSGT